MSLQYLYGFPPSQPAIWGVVAMQLALGKRDISRRNYRTYHRHNRYLAKQAAQIWLTAMERGTALYYMGPEGMREVAYDDKTGSYEIKHG